MELGFFLKYQRYNFRKQEIKYFKRFTQTTNQRGQQKMFSRCSLWRT